jgi:hypothetical protein
MNTNGHRTDRVRPEETTLFVISDREEVLSVLARLNIVLPELAGWQFSEHEVRDALAGLPAEELTSLVQSTRLSLEQGLEREEFLAFLRPFLQRLGELAGEPLPPERFPRPPDLLHAEASQQNTLAAQAIYLDFLMAAYALAGRGIEAPGGQELEDGDSEGTAEGRWLHWLSHLPARVRRYVWPTAADCAAELLDALQVYNSYQPPARHIDIPELDDLKIARATQQKVFPLLERLVAAIDAAEPHPLPEDGVSWMLLVALDKARKLIGAGGAKAEPIPALVPGEEGHEQRGGSTGEFTLTVGGEEQETATYIYDPDADPLWKTAVVAIIAALIALVLGGTIVLLATRSLNSPWVTVATMPGFVLFAAGMACGVALLVKVKRLEHLGLYTFVEEDPEPAKPMGQRAWTFLWGLVVVVALLAIVCDGYPLFVDIAALLIPFLVFADLVEMGVTRRWLLSHLGWVAPIFLLPPAALWLLAESAPYTDPSMSSPHLHVNLPTLSIAVGLGIVECLLVQGMKRSWRKESA